MNTSPVRVVALVSAIYNVDKQSVLEHDGRQRVCYVRAVCYYFLSEMYGRNIIEIALMFGRSKQAVRKVLRNFIDQLGVDRALRNEMEHIGRVLNDEILMQCDQR